MKTLRFWILKDQIVMNTVSDFFSRKIIADYIYLVILDILQQAITITCDSGHLRSISQVTLDILMKKLTAWTETDITLTKNRLGKISMNT